MLGPWKEVVIAKDGSTSAEVDLGGSYKQLLVLIPTIDSATVSVHISNNSGGTFYPVHHHDGVGANSLLDCTVAGTGGIAYIFNVGGVEYVKIVTGAAQTTAARTFLVRGC